MDQKSKLTLTFALILIILGVLFFVESQKIGKLRMIFCDVGQGDGMLIVTPGGKQIVVDGGPGKKIVDCLGAKMPFWDRTIEMMLLSHAQQDHFEGQIEIFKRYKVERVGFTGVGNETSVFAEWKRLLDSEKSEVFTPDSGDLIDIKSLGFDILWPSQLKIDKWKTTPPKDLNESSIVLRLDYGQFCAYLTGDIPKEILEGLTDKSCQLLKIAHHGSKTGTNQVILEKIKPKIAVIQVGKNRYGHPTKEVLDLLSAEKVDVYRNDIHGAIELQTDGKSYKVN